MGWRIHTALGMAKVEPLAARRICNPLHQKGEGAGFRLSSLSEARKVEATVLHFVLQLGATV